MSLSKEIKQSIESISHAEYDVRRTSRSDKHHGSSKNIYWNGNLVMEALDEPLSYCVGAVAEAVIEALKLAGYEQKIPLSDIEEFIKYTFVWDADKYYQGVAGGVVELEWGYWIEEYDVEYGDVAQYWHENGEEYSSGHSVILTGYTEVKGKDCFTDWSSSPSRPSGHKNDWHYIELTKNNGHQRTWYIARICKESLREKYG